MSAVREYLGAAIIVGLTTGLGLLLRSRLATIDVAMLFLLAVVVSATRYRRAAALFASLLAIAAFDFAFVPPYYTFDVNDAAYTLTFAMMLVVAFVMSHLTARVRLQAEEAAARERRTRALLELDRDLAGAGSGREIIEIAGRHLGRSVGAEATVVLAGPSAHSDPPTWPADGLFESVEARVAATWAFRHGQPAGRGTGHCGEAEVLLLPLCTRTRIIGMAAIGPEPKASALTPDERATVMELTDQTAAALERALLAERSDAARAEAEAERLRTSLLSSLSHDLRTPLATIEGAAGTLVQQGGCLPAEAVRQLAGGILDESRRMSRLVSNLLDMVRVETGALAVHKEWQPLEEALGVALLRLDDPLSTRRVLIELPDDLPLVPIDELLIEQVFINLLENAIRYTPPGTPIGVRAWPEDGSVVVEVCDEGVGIARGSEEAVFRKFFRGGGGPEGGSGLGLTICRGIVTAHGGRIWVEPRPGGGASFRFTLPLEGPPRRDLPPDAAS